MHRLKYCENLPKYDALTTVVAKLDSKISGKDMLLRRYYDLLRFPEYFGFNWDALCDCLSDLDWIESRRVVVFHDGLPLLNDNDMQDYIEILKAVLERWERSGENKLEVIFKEEDRVVVEKIFGK